MKNNMDKKPGHIGYEIMVFHLLSKMKKNQKFVLAIKNKKGGVNRIITVKKL
jgi:hypothetical protein